MELRVTAQPAEGNAPFSVRFTADHNSPVESDLRYEWDFGDGQESDETNPRHRFETAGEYTITVKVKDESQGLDGVARVNVVAHEPADLVVSDLELVSRSSRLENGDEVDLSWAFENRGADGVGQWRQVVFLSMDTRFDSDDITIAELPQGAVPRSERPKAFQQVLTIPDTLPSGDWWVGVFADPEGLIGDLDRDNNYTLSLAPIQVRNATDTGPDLSLCGVSIPAFDGLQADVMPTAQLDDQLVVETCVGNPGNRPVSSGRYDLYLSADESFNDTDLRVGQRGGVVLGPGDVETYEDTIELSGDVTPGDWYLLAIADPEDELSEQREDNNTRRWYSAFSVVEPGQVEGVDLVIRSLEPSSSRVYWGQNFSARVTLQNRGSLPVERFFVVRFSALPIDGGPLIQLHSLNVSGIAAAEEQILQVSFPINGRIAAGRYRLMAVADPTNSVDDVNEANNTRTVQDELYLGGEADTALSVRDVRFTVDGADSSTLVVRAGNLLNVTGRITNDGIDPSGAIEVGVIMSADPNFSSDDTLLETFRAEGITGGGDAPIQRDVLVPFALDQQVSSWRVGLIIDPFRELDADEDGTRFAFSAQVLNVTGAEGGCSLDEFEPNDAHWQAREVSFGEVDDLGACTDADWFKVVVPAEETLDVSLNWPSVEGSLGLRVTDTTGQSLRTAPSLDGRAALFLEPAEVSRTILVEATSQGPALRYGLAISSAASRDAINLRVRDLETSPGIGQPGQPLGLAYTLVNVGDIDAPAGIAGIHLNHRATRSGARYLAGLPMPAVGAGQSIDVLGSVELPADVLDGQYFIGVQADVTEEIPEKSDDDNLSFSILTVDSDQLCPADVFEPNLSPFENSTAPSFPRETEAGEFQDLTLCVGDDDWYAIRLLEGQQLAVDMFFQHALADLELTLYAPDGTTVIDESNTLNDQENVSLSRVEQAGLYYIRTYINSGDPTVQAQYALHLTVSAADRCDDDNYEPNGDISEAKLLRDGVHSLKICPGDEDWFRFAVPAGNTVSWLLTAPDDVEMGLALSDSNGALASDARAITHQAQRNGDHFLRVFLGEDAAIEEPKDYLLRVRGVSGVELQAEALELVPPIVEFDADLQASFTLSNQRGDAASDLSVKFYLSPTPELGAAAPSLGETLIPSLGGAETLSVDQRLSLPGRADLLGSLGTTTLPATAYVIASIDPERTQPDLDRSNNEISTLIEFTERCVDDDPRDNEGPQTAITLDPLAGRFDGGVICPYTEDWFALEISRAGQLALDLAYPEGQGDLELEVLDASTLSVLGTTSGSDETQLRITIEQPGTVFLGVDGFSYERNTYTLSWTLP